MPFFMKLVRFSLRVTLPFIVLFPWNARTQESVPGFRRYTVESGLSQGTITSILQDHEGFIWVGTHDGLNRFDGIEFRTYRHIPGETSSLSNSWITSIHEDERHRLWIGTIRGLNEFDRRTESFRTYPSAGPEGRFTPDYGVSLIQSTRGTAATDVVVTGQDYHLVDPAAGVLLLLPRTEPEFPEGDITGTKGPWIWRGGALYSLASIPRRAVRVLDLGTRHITAVLPAPIDSPGELLIGTIEGLMACNPGTGGKVRIGGVPIVHAMLPDTGGRVWLATNDGLWTVERGVSRRPARAGLEGMAVLSLCLDSSGTLWAGSHGGLYRKQNSSPGFTVYRHRDDNPNSLVSDFVMPIMEDRSGRIWFGTIDRGVSVLSAGNQEGPRFRNYPKRSGDADGPWGNNVRSILQTRDGMVWMGTDAGLTVCDTGPRFIERYQRGSADDSTGLWVDALLETRDGTLWAGSTPSRLIRVDRARNRPPSFVSFPLLTAGESSSAAAVNVIVEGAGGELWVGAESGLFRFDPRSGATKRYAGDTGDPPGLSNSFVWSLDIEARDGREILWVGTSQGLNRFDPATGIWKTYLRQEGFPSDWIYGILRDGLGRLWLTTNHGITCFDGRKPEGKQFRNFDVTDGIAGNECNRRSYARLRGGDFMFGGTNGVTRFNPLHLSENRSVPPVVLTAILKAGRRMPLDLDMSSLRELRLGHDENNISFEFAALDYTNPMKNSYAYMMQGLEKDWVFIGSRRFAGYAGLDPGEYVFRVKASNNDGVWNENGISVAVVIEPPVWETWWFRGIAAALIVLAVVAVVRARERRAAEILGIRRRIARDLHDEIGSNLTGIAVSGSLLKDSGRLSPEQENRISDITSIAVKTSDLMRDLIWVIRPENDRLDDLCFRMKDAAAGILAGSKCRFIMPEDASAHVLNLVVKHNLYLIYKEIITNIARHARADEVIVVLEISGGRLVLTVSDDGRGFDTAKETTGMGLKNLSHRASAVGGTIDIRSAPGGGTRITVIAPFT